MIEEQVGNASTREAPENLISDDATSDFFGELDKSLNGGILDSDESETSHKVSGNTQTEGVVQQEDIETLQKRYSDSSKEGKRLNQRLKELEPYLPILDEMRKDPKLISHVRNYFDGGGQAPESVTEKLDLGEDFIFDPDDAVSNPKSDSAKVLNHTIDGVVQRRLANEMAKQREQLEMESTINEFKKKHNMSDEDWNEFSVYADKQTLSLDDILFLKNRENQPRERKSGNRSIVPNAKPQSIATVGSTTVQKSEDDSVFDAILGIDKQLDSAFG